MIDFCVPSHLHFIDKDTLGSWYDATILRVILLCVFTCVVCVSGLVGNGAVIWLLGFRIKRNSFTTYILNLAVADCGVLIVSIPLAVTTIIRLYNDIPWNVYNSLRYAYIVSACLSYFFYSMSQFLLTAISTDRCVSVLFPLWYRCRRPKNFSTVLCALIWLLTSLVNGICVAVHFTKLYHHHLPLFIGLLVHAMICLPLTTASTLFLFFRFCFKSQQRQRGKLLMAVLLTLFFFLIFAFPLNVIYLITFNPWSSYEHILKIFCSHVAVYGTLCASLNSFVNPLLYFLVGRKKKGLCRENLKLILRRVFTEEEEGCREEPGTQL